MEPLVEVHTDREMEIAKVIGVNNRNLHTFKLDLDTTERAIGIAAKKGFTWQLTASGELPDIMIAALSGITSSDDVALFRKAGVSCVLVGETLMKSSNPKQTIAELLGEVPAEGDASKRVLVKTCGVTSSSDAESALQAGASLIGSCLHTSRTVIIALALHHNYINTQSVFVLYVQGSYSQSHLEPPL
jgi:anthranilate synthase / indole-3-glycerol phosphate synthase / phosphoribosylanthranilate isomerase